MCGINGFIKNIEHKEAEKLIKKMNQTIIHRWPDDNGTYVETLKRWNVKTLKGENMEIWLGQVRLAIIDLTDAWFQPMFYNKDVGCFSQKHHVNVLDEIGEKSISIVFNGEIYNYQDIRKELINKWYNFSSNSDTEVILASYLERWTECITKFNGMRAFALYDPNKQKLFFSRDRMGKKPLYYYWDGKKFIYSSEIKWILATWIERILDKETVPEYITFHYTPGTKTLVKNIFKLPAAHNLIFNIMNNSFEIKKYRDIKDDNILYTDFAETKQKIDDILNDAVKIRTEASDVPVWTFLSWWLDSSLVSALFKKYYKGKEFHTFNVVWDSHLPNEWDFAEIVAKHIGSTHHRYQITGKDIKENIRTLQCHYCDPISEAGFIPNYFVSKYAKEYVKVVLTGDGADEIFAGYSYYNFLQKFWKLGHIPGVKTLAKILAKTLPTSKYQKWFEFLSNASKEKYDKFFGLTVSNFSQKELDNLLTDTFDKQKNYLAVIKHTIKNFDRFLSQLMYTDQRILLENCYNIKPDKALMGNSLEWRAPMEDYRLVELSYHIPNNFKIKGNKEKYILTQVAKAYLPKEIFERKKQGFGVPIYEWINGELKDMVTKKLEDSLLVKAWYFHKQQIDFYLKNIDKKYFSTRIWTLFSLELFIEVYDLKIE